MSTKSGLLIDFGLLKTAISTNAKPDIVLSGRAAILIKRYDAQIEAIVTFLFVIYLASKSGVTLKTGLGFVQGHWKWHHLIDRIRVPIRLP